MHPSSGMVSVGNLFQSFSVHHVVMIWLVSVKPILAVLSQLNALKCGRSRYILGVQIGNL